MYDIIYEKVLVRAYKVQSKECDHTVVVLLCWFHKRMHPEVLEFLYRGAQLPISQHVKRTHAPGSEDLCVFFNLIFLLTPQHMNSGSVIKKQTSHLQRIFQISFICLWAYVYTVKLPLVNKKGGPEQARDTSCSSLDQEYEHPPKHTQISDPNTAHKSRTCLLFRKSSAWLKRVHARQTLKGWFLLNPTCCFSFTNNSRN